MKASGKISDKIVSTGRQNIEKTEDYKKQTDVIRHEIELKYSELVKKENDIFKKTILILKKRLEIKKAINKLTSFDKMYLK